MFLQGKGQTKMIHAPDSGSEFSRRSSLNSEEKFLFDELQNELITLKRAMRSKEEDASKKVSENFLKKIFQEHYQSVKQFESRSVGPDLDSNCLQRLSAEDKSRHKQGKIYACFNP